MEYILSKEELIEYAKLYLKQQGFKKKNNRWIKETTDFTISFLIQGSSFAKGAYYIRTGVFINALISDKEYYGDFMREIEHKL